MPTRLLGRTLLLLAALSSGGATAQFPPLWDVVTVNPSAPIPDDAYDGTLASMVCADLDFSNSAITNVIDVTLDLGIDHTWIGDLTVKVVNPGGSVLTVLSRPGFNEPADDGTGCCGDSSDMSADFPLTYGDQYTDPAETMGNTILGAGVVCRDDGRCEYFPSPGAGPGTNFAQFKGQAASGVWQVCVGDSVGGDPGVFETATLTISGGDPPWCLQDLSATLDDDTPAPGQIITFSVTVTNNAASPAPLDLWLDATGPVSRTLRLGSGTVPAGATVTRNVRVRVPSGVPSGRYFVDLYIGTFSTYDICDLVGFTIDVAAPLWEGDLADTEFTAQVSEGDFLAAAAEAASVAVSPNPFRDRAALRFALAAPADVRLAVYDVLGREVAVLVDGPRAAGAHEATFDARGLSAGTYVYRLMVGGAVQTGRMTLTR